MSYSATERLNVFTLHEVKREFVKNFCASKNPKILFNVW